MLKRPASALLLLAGFAASACTAILVPDQDGSDDGVVRCNNTDDCPDPEDNRFVAACVYGEGQDQQTPKVCVADFDDRTCNPTSFAGDHPVAITFEDASDAAILYVACTSDNFGRQGCPAGMAGCNDGLTLTEENICDDDDPETPKAVPANMIAEEVEPAGQA